MITFNSTKQQPSYLAIDFGNEECNFILNGARGRFLNRINTAESFKSNTHKVTIGGNEVYVGEGKLNNNPIKSDREYLEYQIAAAIGNRIDKPQIYINLACGMPPKQYKNPQLKQQFMDKLNNIKSKGIKYTYDNDGVERIIHILDIEIMSEAYSAFNAIVDKVDINKNIVLLDIGGGSSDAMSFYYDYDEEMWQVDGHYTQTEGAIDYKNTITGAINDEFPECRFNYEESPDRVDTLMKRKTFQTRIGEQVLSKYEPSIDPLVSRFITRIKPEVGDLSSSCVVLIGGASEMFMHSVQRIEKETKITILADTLLLDMEERIFANVQGMYDAMIR